MEKALQTGVHPQKLFNSLFDDGIRLAHGIKTKMKNKLSHSNSYPKLT